MPLPLCPPIDKTFRIYAVSDANRDNSANQLTQSYVLHFIDPMCLSAAQKNKSSFSRFLFWYITKNIIRIRKLLNIFLCVNTTNTVEIEYFKESSPNNNQFISPNL